MGFERLADSAGGEAITLASSSEPRSHPFATSIFRGWNIRQRWILGLSKMNWNTFDLYTKLPATIDSSNEIARIGTMLDRFSEASYDYRLFM
jgi:hypothetical protein